ncbi:murein hydrolase activator EnvC family protein [Microbacterium sp. NPDC056234]|uniref:murein hydrolase activator EnvC family protein n=1 Tax=Microbacterium sp. NPDC056234 TaxID=3345757 RepID=UPI0035E3B116
MSARFTRLVRSLVAALVLGGFWAGPPQAESAEGDWQWPVSGRRHVVEPFIAPAHAYASGHRGIDIAVDTGGEVRAPAAGVVAFVGTVVDRPLLTIDHGGGLVTTFEPVMSTLRSGEDVSAGDTIGTLSSGGHAAGGTLHVGLRVHGVYVDPMMMFGPVERAVLLPCCAPL